MGVLDTLDTTHPKGDTHLISELDNYLRETRQALVDFGTTEHHGDGVHRIPGGYLADMQAYVTTGLAKYGCLYVREDTWSLYFYDANGVWRLLSGGGGGLGDYTQYDHSGADPAQAVWALNTPIRNNTGGHIVVEGSIELWG